MATLDDIPILPPTTPTTDDLIAVIDGADRRSPKQATLAQLGALIGGTPTATSIATALETATGTQAESIRDSIKAVGYNPAATVVVNATGTDLERGSNLVAAYAAAKLLTPNGSALARNNRAAVLIPTGAYELASTLVLDAEFVDLIALTPTPPSRRLSSDVDDDTGGTLILDSYRPQPTVVFTSASGISTISQEAGDIRLHGFTISQLAFDQLFGFEPVFAGLFIQDIDNSASVYSDMYFWSAVVSLPSCSGMRAFRDVAGTWTNCVGNTACFRLGQGYDGTVSVTSAVFSADMYDCDAGPYSFIGDFSQLGADYVVRNARFERCRALGDLGLTETNGTASFSGCGLISSTIESTVTFVDCVGGDRNFGIGTTVAGTFIRCRAGANSFAGTTDAAYPGLFTGYAEDCVGGPGSFGGRSGDGTDAAKWLANCSGELIRCTIEGNDRPLNLKGARLRDCRITNDQTGQHGLVVLDSDSIVTNSEIVVLQGGTGIPISVPSGSITAFANAGSGKVTVTSAVSNLTNGTQVTISGTTNYNGTFTVSNATTNTYEITDTWVSNDATGTWVVTSRNVAAAHCRMNNATNDADGIHANLTNTIGTPYNVVDDQMT